MENFIITTESDYREKAFRICRDYLNGSWRTMADSNEMIFKQVTGGLSNLLYYCALPPTTKSKNGEPAEVLVRFYGQILGERALELLLTESVIVTLLSERNIGPKLYGVFPGGRLEEFYPARPLKTKELSDPDISVIIAKKMGELHSLNAPINKEPKWIWDKMNHCMSTAKSKKLLMLDNSDGIKGKMIENIQLLFENSSVDAEINWLRNYLLQLQSPVVFCHNDFQEGNILVQESSEQKVTEERISVIDYEYCSYNYRGFDLANHFCEWTYDYTVKQFPNFSYQPNNLPSVEQRLLFIRSYLDNCAVKRELGIAQMQNITNGSDHPLIQCVPASSRAEEEMRLLRESDCFILASHFLWGIWSIVNAPVSTIPFGYWEYAEARFTAYFEHKHYLRNKYADLWSDK